MVRMTINAIALFCAGCAGLDPLGSPAVNPETGERDFDVNRGVICREVMGSGDAVGYASAAMVGFRCLDIGEGAPEGCLRYDDGRFSYESPGCSKGPD